MKKNIILVVLILAFISMVGIFAYNEYEYQNAGVHQLIEQVDSYIEELESSVYEKAVRLLESED